MRPVSTLLPPLAGLDGLHEVAGYCSPGLAPWAKFCRPSTDGPCEDLCGPFEHLLSCSAPPVFISLYFSTRGCIMQGHSEGLALRVFQWCSERKRLSVSKRSMHAREEVMMEGLKMSRRDFNKSAVLGTVSLALSAGPAVRNALGANDRIGVGLIGSGSQGRMTWAPSSRRNKLT